MSLQTRRKFLASTSKLGLGLGLAQLSWLGGCVTRPASQAQAGRFKSLASAMQGAVIDTSSPGFLKASQPWNLRFSSLRPAAIARCASVEDIRTALMWAQENHIPLAARSGGHSFAAFSTPPEGLMIDISGLRDVSYDPDSGRATVAAGARNATMYSALPAVSRAITHGRCRQVGVGGLVLGGGVGFSMRSKGLTADQLLETDVLLADGTTRRCNARENADLFWAIRGGGGGNFGIHTSFTFQTFPVGQVTVFKFHWREKLDEIFPTTINLLSDMPEGFGCKVEYRREAGKGTVLELLGLYYGEERELRNLLAPLQHLVKPAMEIIRSQGYWEGQNLLSDLGVPDYTHERSRFAFSHLGDAAFRTVRDYIHRWPGTSSQASWKFFLLGGAISRVPSHATAYVHRAAKSLTAIELNWDKQDSPESVARNERWLSDFHEAMREHTSGYCYQNFIDPAEKDYLHSYYGSNLSRLVRVKKMVDPRNVFHYPQSIPTTI